MAEQKLRPQSTLKKKPLTSVAPTHTHTHKDTLELPLAVSVQGERWSAGGGEGGGGVYPDSAPGAGDRQMRCLFKFRC